MKKIQMAIRIILGLVMVFYIYQDTSLVVGIFALLVLFTFEADAILRDKQTEINGVLHNRIKELEKCVK